jgi:hypothetical protein
MTIFERFFGRADPKTNDDPLVANPDVKDPLSLQLLLEQGPRLDSAAVTAVLRAYDPTMADARGEIAADAAERGTPVGLAGWANHVVKLVGFDQPMPAAAVEVCVAPAHYSQELKARARAHARHLLLYYAAYHSSPLEQYVALTATAGALSRLGGIVVLNEAAHTSFPAAALSGSGVEGDMVDMLRSLPLPILYCGFVKYQSDDSLGVWMRTHAANLLGLPDLATHAEGHHEGQMYFDLFNNILNYLRESGATFAAGHTMQVGPDEYLRCRESSEGEPFFTEEGELLVLERISADEINR